jgi:hypothetical protein
MANHVYSYFEITFKSEEDCNNFAEWIGLDPKDENIAWMARIEACCNIMMDNLYPDNEDTRQWWLDNVGAKWMYFDDVDRSADSSIIINMTSAWDFPEALFYKLSDFLRDRYEDVAMTVTFDDEGYNFIGAAAANQQFRDIDYFHPDFDELDEYKDEDDCWTEEFYEEMSNIKDELLQDVLAFIQQDLEKE